jgi:AcrR family transcriptional regulator
MAVDQQAPRRRLSADDRRAEILAAGRIAFARRGYHGTSTLEIANLAGCSEPTLYKYFPAKQELFAAVLDDAQAAMRAFMTDLLEGADDPLLRMTEVADRLGSSPILYEITRLRMLAVTLVDEPDIRDALERTTRHLRDCVERYARSLQASGEYRSDVAPEQVAWLWLGMISVMGFRTAVYGDAAGDLSEMPETLMRVLRTDTTEEST